MRFVLDNDVDVAGCRRALLDHGHEVMTAAAAGVEGHDDNVTVYADLQKAVVVTHDREFTDRRIELPAGLHVRLTCREWEMEEALHRCLEDLVLILARHDDLTVEVSMGGMKLHYTNQGIQRYEWD